MTLLLELVDIIKIFQNQLEKKSALDHQFYKNYISPMWEGFIKVHDNYLSTFGNYISYSSQTDFDINVLIENIRQDSISSSNLRIDLINHLSAIQASKKLKWGLSGAKPEFEKFLENIQKYFSLPEYLPYAFFQNNENEWTIMIASDARNSVSDYSQILYEDDPTVWRTTKDNVDAIKSLYQKVLENNKTKVYLGASPRHLYGDDFYFINISEMQTNSSNEDERILAEWCHEIYVALSARETNAIRRIVLSFLILNRDKSTTLVVNFLRSALLLLQERYDYISESYYRLRIELLA